MTSDSRPARLPGRIRFTLGLLAANTLIFTAWRLVFLWWFFPPGQNPSWTRMLHALYLGFKFDTRLAIALCLPFVLLSWIPWVDPTKRRAGKAFWTVYFLSVEAVVIVLYFVDFGTYSYLHTRLNATLLLLVENPNISWGMVWQTYPVGRLLILLGLFLVFFGSRLYGSSSFRLPPRTARRRWWATALIYAAFILVLLAAGYGKFSRYPLRWSDAFFSRDNFTSHLALNPVLYFAESLREKQATYDVAAARKSYPLLAAYFNADAPDPASLTLRRRGVPHPQIDRQPNIVLILMETFAAFKTGVTGNGLDPTPRFDALARGGLLFTRFYTPTENTSRSLFSLLFGIPDVSMRYASSRNPLVVRQHSVWNAFTGYDKLYFLGGSANWGNIRGMLLHNIRDLTIYEEGSYTSPVLDVWGISDADLFMEANKVFRGTRDRPFFAIIQTSGNHRPFSIPKDSRGFTPVRADDEPLRRNGFYSLAEYNGLRFLDHCLGYFIDLARAESYFNDTLFVVLGDHGTTGGSLKTGFRDLNLDTFHVPLVFYGPGLVPGGRTIDRPVSELDLLPSLASFVGKPYVNQTLGRDIFDPGAAGPRYVFTFTPFRAPPRLGLIENGRYVNVEPDGSATLGLIRTDELERDITAQQPAETRRMADLARGFYEMSKYLLYHNEPAGN